jgi:hypothetical protein
VTPVAVRGLSAQLVRTQLAYSLSLRGYFAAVEKFANAQVKIADYRIDEITSQMKSRVWTARQHRPRPCPHAGRTPADYRPAGERRRRQYQRRPAA